MPRAASGPLSNRDNHHLVDWAGAAPAVEETQDVVKRAFQFPDFSVFSSPPGCPAVVWVAIFSGQPKIDGKSKGLQVTVGGSSNYRPVWNV